MKKWIPVLLTIFLVFSLLVVGCGSKTSVENQLRTKTDEIFNQIKSFDLEYIQSLVDEEESSSEEENSDASSSTDEELLKSVVGYLSDQTKDITYEIKSVDEEKLSVDVACSYPDTKTFSSNFITGLFAAAFSHLDGSDITDEEMKTVIEAAIPGQKDDIVTKDMTLTFTEKDGQYDLEGDNDDLINVATCGFYGYMKQLSEGFGESDDSTDYKEITDSLTYDLEKYDTGYIMFVTNPTDTDVSVTIQHIFTDENGEMIDEGEDNINCLPAGNTVAVGCKCMDSSYNYAEYTDVDIQLTAEKGYYTDNTEQLILKTSKNDGDVIGKITNEGNEPISQVKAICAFYCDEKLIGFDEGYVWDLQAGKYEAVTFNGPFDYETYDSLRFDDFKVYVYGMSYE